MKKVVILITNAGGGHLSLAKALEQALMSEKPNKYSVTIYDPTPKTFATFYPLLTSGKLSKLWATFWNITNNKIGINIISTVNFLIFGKKLTKFLKESNPDIVISNNPMTIKELCLAKKKSKGNFLTCVHVADPFSAHKIWYSSNQIDLFLVPTEQTEQQAIESNIQISKIKKVGWLTKKQFLNRKDTNDQIRTIHNIGNNDFLIFLGGSGGQENLSIKFIDRFIKAGLHKYCKLIINTGLNPSYIAKIATLTKDYKETITIVPYTQRMDLYLSASNLVVGKAGPNFIFENIHLNKPFIALGCIPGQEEGNLDFIKDEEIGWYLNNPKDYINLIKRLIKDPNNLQKFKANMIEISKEHAKTAENIERELSLILGI